MTSIQASTRPQSIHHLELNDVRRHVRPRNGHASEVNHCSNSEIRPCRPSGLDAPQRCPTGLCAKSHRGGKPRSPGQLARPCDHRGRRDSGTQCQDQAGTDERSIVDYGSAIQRRAFEPGGPYVARHRPALPRNGTLNRAAVLVGRRLACHSPRDSNAERPAGCEVGADESGHAVAVAIHSFSLQTTRRTAAVGVPARCRTEVEGNALAARAPTFTTVRLRHRTRGPRSG